MSNSGTERTDLASEYKDAVVEFRPDGEQTDGLDLSDSLDEVIAKNVTLVHLERMDRNAYWLGLDLDDGRHVRVNFWAGKRAVIRVIAELED